MSAPAVGTSPSASPSGSPPPRRRALLGAGLALVAGPALLAWPRAADAAPLAIEFRGTRYLHRWSQGVQHEFTPESDADLAAWHDMITIVVTPAVHDDDTLAQLQQRLLDGHRRSGRVLRTSTKPRAGDAPPEHFIESVVADPKATEVVFSRLLLREGAGVVVVVSHRVYGHGAGPEAAAWIAANASAIEFALKAWTGLPTLSALAADG